MHPRHRSLPPPHPPCSPRRKTHQPRRTPKPGPVCIRNPPPFRPGRFFHSVLEFQVKASTQALPTQSLTPERFSVRYLAMTTITATKARESLYALINEVRESHEPVQITGKHGNAVLISEEDWRSIRETLFLHSIPGMVDSIQQARAEGLAKAKGSPGW